MKYIVTTEYAPLPNKYSSKCIVYFGWQGITTSGPIMKDNKISISYLVSLAECRFLKRNFKKQISQIEPSINFVISS